LQCQGNVIKSIFGNMENAAWMDWLAGGLAGVILLGGLVMLFGGVSAMNQRK
jgi:hypothetical protein